jgi:hypothetical protein
MGFLSTFRESMGYMLPSFKGWTWLKVREEAGRCCAALVSVGLCGAVGFGAGRILYYWFGR